MIVKITDKITGRRSARLGGRCGTIAGLLVAATLLAGCGDPTRPLITTSSTAPAGTAATGPRTTADGFPNVNVNPVEIPQQAMPPADVTRAEDSLRGAGRAVQASGRAASAVPSQVGTLQKIGASHAEAAAAAIETGSSAAPAPAATPTP